MENKEINYQDDFYPGFIITCVACGSKNVFIDNDMGHSAESGEWGGIHLICADCNAYVTIYGD